MKVSTLILIVVLCIAGYGVYRVVMPLFGTRQSQQKLNGFAVYLQRKGCFGACTRYAVMVHGSGKVGYVGVSHVKRRGPAKAYVSQDKVKDLLRESRHIGFFKYPDKYHPGVGHCPVRAATSKGAVVGVTLQGKTKILHLNFGCPNIPSGLRTFMRDIDTAAGTARWTRIQQEGKTKVI
jgi:hypothetical protein